MKRIVKEPVIRKREIIDAAKYLFNEFGYSNTSIMQIIVEAGVSKGAFYHYFESKKDLLNEIVSEIAHLLHDYINDISKRNSLTILEKLSFIFSGAEKNLILQENILQEISKDGNREIQERVNIFYIKEIVPIITDIFNKGYNQNLWSNKVSVQNMQIILGGYQYILDSGLVNLTQSERDMYLSEVELMLEKVLGAKSGVFNQIFQKIK